MNNIQNIDGKTRYLSIGNACNLRCTYCYNDKTREDFTFFYKYLDLLKVVDAISKNGIKYIVIVGGEPLMHPDILNILKYIKKKGFDHIFIVTNGTRFSDKKFLDEFLEIDVVTDIKFSINAHNLDLDNIIVGRKAKDFFKREEGINNLIQKTNNIKFYSNLVITRDNYKYLQEIIDYTKNLGINDISLSFIYEMTNFSKDNINSLVKYSKVIDIINLLNISGIKLRIDWLPYCLHKNITLDNYSIREVLDYHDTSDYRIKKDYSIHNKIKLDKCNNCEYYLKYCNGVLKTYIKEFGEKEF